MELAGEMIVAINRSSLLLRCRPGSRGFSNAPNWASRAPRRYDHFIGPLLISRKDTFGIFLQVVSLEERDTAAGGREHIAATAGAQ
jgi:hypothetical protein